jgi:hypothetical protein
LGIGEEFVIEKMAAIPGDVHGPLAVGGLGKALLGPGAAGGFPE